MGLGIGYDFGTARTLMNKDYRKRSSSSSSSGQNTGRSSSDDCISRASNNCFTYISCNYCFYAGSRTFTSVSVLELKEQRNCLAPTLQKMEDSYNGTRKGQRSYHYQYDFETALKAEKLYKKINGYNRYCCLKTINKWLCLPCSMLTTAERIVYAFVRCCFCPCISLTQDEERESEIFGREFCFKYCSGYLLDRICACMCKIPVLETEDAIQRDYFCCYIPRNEIFIEENDHLDIFEKEIALLKRLNNKALFLQENDTTSLKAYSTGRLKQQLLTESEKQEILDVIRTCESTKTKECPSRKYIVKFILPERFKNIIKNNFTVKGILETRAGEKKSKKRELISIKENLELLKKNESRALFLQLRAVESTRMGRVAQSLSLEELNQNHFSDQELTEILSAIESLETASLTKSEKLVVIKSFESIKENNLIVREQIRSKTPIVSLYDTSPIDRQLVVSDDEVL